MDGRGASAVTGQNALAIFAPGGDGTLVFGGGAEDEANKNVKACIKLYQTVHIVAEQMGRLQPRAKRKKAATREKSST